MWKRLSSQWILLFFLGVAVCLPALQGCADGGADTPSPTPVSSPQPTEQPGFTDLDGDGFASGSEGSDPVDCDDQDRHTYPGATEVPYDGIDQDCDSGDLIDVDGDGYDATEAEGDDCDDEDLEIHPDAIELADGLDNDCDGRIDEDLDQSDEDEDGYSVAKGDCDDSDASIHPKATDTPYDGIDQDCSGGDLTDVDGDGYDGGARGADCDDDDSSIHPGAPETPYDGIDQDCNGADQTDVDGDGSAGGPNAGEEGGDCDDNDPSRRPGLAEVAYDGIDQDCSGADLTDVDGDGQDADSGEVLGPVPTDCDDSDRRTYLGAAEIPYDGIDQDCDDADLTDVDADGYPATVAGGSDPTDCDDNDANINPGASEYADGRDNNCNGQIDEGLDSKDDDGDGYSEQQSDCNDGDAGIHPGATEVCDSKDNNCDGVVDKDAVDRTTFYQDGDLDGYGDPSKAVLACKAGVGQVKDNTDCDDSNASSHPGATELCDGKDNNCDGQIDEGMTTTWYRDADNDEYGNPAISSRSCSQPTGYVRDNTDCDDTKGSIHPGGAETCNGIDDDCDGQLDEGVTSLFYLDADADGYGESVHTTQACTVPAGYSTNSQDCDDHAAGVHPGASELCNGLDDDCDGSVDNGVSTYTYYRDQDGDAFGDASSTQKACTAAPPGYSSVAGDCNDKDGAIHPGATELCNGIDDDCDAVIDDGVQSLWYQDADGDGYGNPAVSKQGCAQPTGHVADKTDCDDSSSKRSPGVAEVCDGVDNDCDGSLDEGVLVTYYLDADGDGYGRSSITSQGCSAPQGYVSNSSDCNDLSAAAYPGGTETCDGLDNNCDGKIDEGVGTIWHQDADSDGYGSVPVTTQACTKPAGYVSDSSDCDDTNGAIHPGVAESCDSKDNDCNGKVDDGVGATWYRDLDGDGYGDPAVTQQACAKPTGYVADPGAPDRFDCDDSSNKRYPGNAETCDGLDNDCNAKVDDGVGTLWYQDADADGYGNPVVSQQACSKPTGYVADKTDCDDTKVAVHPGATEILNSIDDNCDGQIDEGLGGPVNVTFTVCSQTGATGPSQTQCDNTYTSADPLYQKVTVVGGIQKWTVPYNGTYRITAYGAQGGIQSAYAPGGGGKGAVIQGDFTLTAGTVLQILVGQKGKDGSYYDVGGGGGSFVVKSDNTALLVAGGGGSAGNCGSFDTATAPGQSSIGNGNGGGSGNDGSWCGCGGDGSAGGGFNTNGGGDGGRSFLNGGAGATTMRPTQCVSAGWGGFGGGGNGGNGGPGGGGYQGGDAGGSGVSTSGYVATGKGGKSYNTGSSQVNTTGANTGNGKVTIVRQ